MIASDTLFDSRDGFSGLYGYMDDVMFAHNQRGKGHTNRAYTQSDSRGGSTCGEVMTFTVALQSHATDLTNCTMHSSWQKLIKTDAI